MRQAQKIPGGFSVNRIFVAFVCGLITLSAAPAWAYIDPGTGGYVYSMLAPMLAMAGAALAFLFRPVRALFGKLFSIFKKKSED